MGATAEGKKELIAVADGYRESEQSWKELLLDVQGPWAGDRAVRWRSATGRWASGRRCVRSGTRPRSSGAGCTRRRTSWTSCPRAGQPKAKAALHEIYGAETKAEAEKAFDLFVKTYEAKYPKATECLAKDRGALLAFYDFPAEHWVHIRTTNPIESVFSTVRLRHDKTKGSGSRVACLTMVFKLMESASKGWRSLNGSPLLAEVVKGVVFIDGIREKPAA